MANAATSAATIVDPTGVPAKIEITIPESAQSTDRTAEKIVTILKLWKSRMADSAGKMTSAEISSDPRIPAAVLALATPIGICIFHKALSCLKQLTSAFPL